MSTGAVAWDIALAVSTTILGAILGFVASNPEILPPLFRARSSAWSGLWWSVWQDTEDPKKWNINEGVFYARFRVLKFKTTKASPRQWEASGTVDDLWYCGKWKSLRHRATARGTFMFRRPALEGNLAGYFLSPTNSNDLVSIAAIFTQDQTLVAQIAAAGDRQHAVAMDVVRELLRRPRAK